MNTATPPDAPRVETTRAAKAVAVGAGVVAVIATPVAAWWLVGDQSFNGHRRRDELDYMFRAPQISGWITTVAGIVALIAAIGGVATLIVCVRRREIDARWLDCVGALMATGVVLSAVWRDATAGVVGANIGGGLAIFFGGGLIVALVVWAALRAWWIVTHPNAPAMGSA